MRSRRGIIQAGACFLIIALFSAGCTQRDSSGPAAQKQRPPEPPPRVRPPRIKPNLAAAHIEKCLYRQRVPPSALAGAYYGPIDLVADQVEESRQLEFDTPTDIEMLEARQFARAFDRLVGERDRSEEYITRLLAWALGYTPHLLDVHSFIGVEGGSGLIAGFYNHKDKSVWSRRRENSTQSTQCSLMSSRMPRSIKLSIPGTAAPGGWSMTHHWL
jgi:hypothetical protein